MIRFVFRFIGLWLLAGGFVALIVDGTRSIASSEIVFTPLGEAWFTFSAGTLAAFQNYVSTTLSPGAWANVAVPALTAPLAAVLGGLGLLLLLIGRRPDRRAGPLD